MTPIAQARLVLSGGIGSGKSTAGRMLAERGADVIDADEVGHRVLEPDGAAYDDVCARWPEAVADNLIDRSALGDIVFADPVALAELESMTHPAIRDTISDRLAASRSPLAVVEIPLLSDFLGDDWQRVIVDVPDETRVQRLLDRGMTRADIDQRMGAQPTRQEWLDAADYVIDNSGDQAALEAEVTRLIALVIKP